VLLDQEGLSIDPIIRWAGSKRKLVPRLLRCIPKEFRNYVEPFAGSACLFFSLSPKKAVLGDFNKELMQAYSEISRDVESVYRSLVAFPRKERDYYRIREVNPVQLSPSAQAARFLYLNRFCFNGVYRTNRRGHFNVPRGKDTGTLPSLQAFQNCSLALSRAKLICDDFEAVLSEVREKDFVYLDPPYAKADDRHTGEYGYGGFSSADLGRLFAQLDRLNSIGATFLLSYRYSKSIHKELRRWNTSVLYVRRHVAGFSSDRRIVRELLVSNRSIQGLRIR
jgi:DNA adenine methylase